MRLYIIVVLSCLCSLVRAQQFKVEDIGSLKDNKNDFDIIKVANGFIAVEYSAKKQMAFSFTLDKLRYTAKLIKYDEKLNIIKEVALSGGERVFGPFIPFLKNISNKIFLFFHRPSDNESEIVLYASEVDESTLEQKTPKKILAINQKNIGVFKASDLFSSQKLIANNFPDYRKTILAWSAGVNNEIYISVVDQNMDLLWSKHEIVAAANEIKLSSACVDKNGTAFISYINKNKNDKRGFLFIAKQDAAAINMELVIDGATVHHAFVSPGDNEMIIAGTYRENSNELLTGAFSQHISTNNFAVSNKFKYRFPEALVEQFKNDSYGSNKNKDFGILANSDFEHVIMEDASVSISGDLNRFAGVKVSERITGSILHIWVKKGGVVFSRIPKSEVPVYNGNESTNLFYPFAYKDKMLVLYNDRHQFLDGGNEKTARNDNPYSQLIVAIIDKDGTVARKELSDVSFKYGMLGLAVEKIRPINNSVLMLPTLNNRMGILKIAN